MHRLLSTTGIRLHHFRSTVSASAPKGADPTEASSLPKIIALANAPVLPRGANAMNGREDLAPAPTEAPMTSVHMHYNPAQEVRDSERI